ncbi:43074_t:CDS:2, partial [Gigaspora margarita]
MQLGKKYKIVTKQLILEKNVVKDFELFSSEDPKPKVSRCRKSLFKLYWNNIDCDDSIEKVKSAREVLVNIVDTNKEKDTKS